MPKVKIHTVLRRMLKERKMTAVELSRAAGVPNSTLQNWLTAGSGKPKDPEQMASVAKVLSITLHQLLFDEIEETQPTLATMKSEVVLDGYFRLKLERVIMDKE